MNKSFLNSVLGFVVGCLIVAGAGGGYWYWLQAKKAQPSQPTKTPQIVNTQTTRPSETVKSVEKPTLSENVVPTKIKMSRAIAGGDMYSPGQPVDVTIKLEAEGTDPVRALGIEEHIPAGWRFDSMIDGIRPDITPRNPESQTLEFAWFNIPEFPATFTYRLIAGGAVGAANISGETIFRTSGPEFRSGVVDSKLDLAGSPVSSNKAPKPAIEAAKPVPAPVPALTKELPGQGHSITSDFALSFNGQAAGYKPGVDMPFEVAVDYAGADTVTALAIQLKLPPSWRFKAITGGEQPAVPPKEGAQGEVALVWINIPQYPSATQFSLSVPETATGPQTLGGQIIYRTNAGELRSAEVDVMIQPEG